MNRRNLIQKLAALGIKDQTTFMLMNVFGRTLKKDGTMPRHVEHRQAKYLNNRLEADHGQLKRLIRPTLGFKSMRSARATIAGFELMRMFRKGQFRFWIEAIGGGTEVRFINRLFGLYA